MLNNQARQFLARASTTLVAALPEKKNPKAMLKVVLKAEAKMAAVRKAMDAVIEITSTLPEEFRKNIHSGSTHNLDTPKEYSIGVNVQDLKNLYTLNQAFKDTMASVGQLKKGLTEYK